MAKAYANQGFGGGIAIEDAIDRHPLVVTPDTPLVEAIALMNQTRGSSCSLSKAANKDLAATMRGARSSCVLVMSGSDLVGIFTERDIVQLTAKRLNLEEIEIGQVMTQSIVSLPETNLKDVFAPLFLFRRYSIRHLPIVDSQGGLVGTISPESIRQVLQPVNLLKLRRVADVMSQQIIHAPLTVSILTLAQLMAQHRVSCVVIVEGDENSGLLPVGIVTERDLVQFQYLQLELGKIEAGEVMSTPLFLLTPEDSLFAAYQEMERRRVRRLVVSWNWGKGLGIVTQTSLLRVFDPMEMYGAIELLQSTVRELETQKAVLEGQVNYPSEEVVATVNSHSENENKIESLLSKLQVGLESLVKEPNLSSQLRQAGLEGALADLEQIRFSMNN